MEDCLGAALEGVGRQVLVDVTLNGEKQRLLLANRSHLPRLGCRAETTGNRGLNESPELHIPH